MKTSWRVADEEVLGHTNYKFHWQDKMYLSELTLNASCEVYNYMRKRKDDFCSSQEFAEYIKEEFINSMEKGLTHLDPTLAIISYHAFAKIDNKSRKKVEELGLDMKVLAGELGNVENVQKERLRGLRDTCLEFSREFFKYARKDRRCIRRLAG